MGRINLDWIPSAYRNSNRTGHQTNAQEMQSIEIPAVGTINYYNQGGREFWFEYTDVIGISHSVELNFDTTDKQPPTEQQVNKIQEVITNIEIYLSILYDYLATAYREFAFETIKSMYFLCAVEVKIDAQVVWFTLEAYPRVPSIYDGFKRFTVIDKNVTWSNVL